METGIETAGLFRGWRVVGDGWRNWMAGTTETIPFNGCQYGVSHVSIPVSTCFFTNQLTGFIVPLQARPAVSNLTILISCYVMGWLRWTLNHSVLLDLVSVYISTLVCLEDRKWCGLIGSLQKNNQYYFWSCKQQESTLFCPSVESVVSFLLF